MGGLQAGKLFQHGQHAPRRFRLAAHDLAPAFEEQHQGGFHRFVGVLPYPGALGVGGAEGLGHGLAQDRGVQGLAGFESRQQNGRGGEQRGGF